MAKAIQAPRGTVKGQPAKTELAKATAEAFEIKADKSGGMYVKEGDVKLHVSGPTLAMLAKGQDSVSKGYAFYRKAWPMFLEDAGNDASVFEPGSALYKLALRVVKQSNPDWVKADKGYRDLSAKAQRSEAEEAQRAGFRSMRDDAARVASNAMQRMVAYYLESLNEDDEADKASKARKSPRQVIEAALQKLGTFETSKNWSEADKRLARIGQAALRAVLTGTWNVAQIVPPAAANPATAPGPVTVTKETAAA